ncbi:XYh8X [Senna tora]|uniref:XYh8X n=1 Tax=Senna tora TaxID=362788 RepID=A0A834WE93_9FABA|nr:XYh8X [Senna tora]
MQLACEMPRRVPLVPPLSACLRHRIEILASKQIRVPAEQRQTTKQREQKCIIETVFIDDTLTPAVAKYLQALFDKEDLHGRNNLPLDNIIAGKTRKEASRMFFETLVLKTKDYVHVEQTKPFANINIKPRMKLMKSDF